MADDQNTEIAVAPDRKEWVASKLYFSSLYFVTVGVLHLWGYWPTFGINILEYLELTDIIKVTAYPIAFTIIFMAISSYGGELLAKRPIAKLEANMEDAIAHAEQTGTARELKRVGDKFNKIKKIGFILFGLVVLLGVALYIAGSVYAWTFLPISAAMAASYRLLRSQFISLQIPNENARMYIICLLTGIPAYAFSFASMASQNIVEGTTYKYVVSESSDPKNNNIAKQFRYVGHAGDYLFFYDPVREATVISKFDDDKPLILKTYSKRIELGSLNEIIKKLTEFVNRFRQ